MPTTKPGRCATMRERMRETAFCKAAARLWGRGWVRGIVELTIAFAVVATCRWEAVRQPYWWDAMGYVADGARGIVAAGMSPLIYWDWDPGHPPLWYYLVAVTWKVFRGDVPTQLFAAHLMIYGFAALGLWATYRIGRAIRDTLTGLMAAGLLFVSAAYFAQAGQLLVDLPIAALSAAAMYCVLRDRPYGYALAATAAVLMKESIIPVLAALMAVAAIEGFSRSWKRGWVWVGMAMVPFVLFGVWWLWRFEATGWVLGSPNMDAQLTHVDSLSDMTVAKLADNFARAGWRWIFGEGPLFYALPLMALGFAPSLSTWRGLIAGMRSNADGRRWRRSLEYVWGSLWRNRALFYTLVVIASVFGSLAVMSYHLGTSARYWLPAYPFMFLLVAMGLRRLGMVPAIVLAVLLGWMLSAEWMAAAHKGFDSTSTLAFNKEVPNRDDSLQYERGVHVLQQMAQYIGSDYPEAKVYCKWPTVVVLDRPEVGYVARKIAISSNADDTDLNLAVMNSFVYGDLSDRIALGRRYTLTPLKTFADGQFKVEVVRLEVRKGPRPLLDYILPGR